MPTHHHTQQYTTTRHNHHPFLSKVWHFNQILVADFHRVGLECWNCGIQKKLADFVIQEKKTWIPKVRGRFQKYLQAFKCIKHAALTHRDLSAAAKFLDDKMGKQCMSDFLAKQMKKHPGIKRRKSKQKPDAGATAAVPNTTATVPNTGATAAVRTVRGRGRQPQQQRQQQRNRTQQNLPLFFCTRATTPPICSSTAITPARRAYSRAEPS